MQVYINCFEFLYNKEMFNKNHNNYSFNTFVIWQGVPAFTNNNLDSKEIGVKTHIIEKVKNIFSCS